MKLALHEQAPLNPLLRRLESIATLSDDDKQAILSLPANVKVVEPGSDIALDDSPATECSLILSGFLCRYKILPDGRRQIIGFHIAGHIPDLQSLYLPVMDHSVGALVRSSVALISHQSMWDLLRSHPHLAEIFWRDTLVDAAILREWMIGLGRRTAYQRMVHLLCEIHLRMKAVGLGREGGCDMPLTHSELADALGLSTVHVNRVPQDLRREGLIVLRGSVLEIPDWEALQHAGEFDPVHLHSKNC